MKTLALLGLLLTLFASPVFAAPSKIFGAAGDASIPPTPPCQVFGFSVENIVTLPVGQNQAAMVRVDRSGLTQIGYILTSQATGYTVHAFNFKTLASLGDSVQTPLGYRNAGRLQGDVGSDGFLYLFYEVLTADPLCPSNNCVVMAKWNGASLVSAVTDSNTGATSNIDDARESGGQFLAGISLASGIRVFRLYDKGSLTRLSTGTDTGVSVFLHVSRALGSSDIYGALSDNTTFPNIFRFAIGTATASGSTSLAYTAGLGISAIFPQEGASLMILDSGNETTPQRAYVTPPTTIAGPQGFPSTSANLGAAFQGSFYDSTNRKVFSLRTNAGSAGLLLRSTVGLTDTFASEERFPCASCVNAGGTTTGSQVVDYAQSFARMYVGSNESPARLTQLKVCAVGGP